jgi:hypothetical protein
MWQVGEIGEVHAGIWWGNVKVRNNLEDQCVDGKLIIKWVSNESFGRAWIRLTWFKLGTNGGNLRTFGFYKMRKVPLRAEKLLAFQEGACTVELVN